MGSKTWIYGVAAVAVLGGACVAVGAYSGSAVRAQYDADFDRAEKMLPIVKFVNRQYGTGLFSSTASYGLQIGCAGQEGDGKTTTIVFNDSIAHGPLPGFAGVGLARIDTKITLPPETPEMLRAWVDKMAIRSTVAFDGATSTGVELPAFEFKDDKAAIRWQPMHIGGGVNGARTAYRADFSLPELTFDVFGTSEGSFKFVNLRGQGEGDLKLVGNASSTGTLDRMQMSFPRGNGQTEDMQLDLSQIKATVTEKVENDLVSVTGAYTGVADLKAGERVVKIDRFEWQESIKRLHAPTLEKVAPMIWQAFLDGACKRADPLDDDGQVEQLLAGLLPMLAHDPEYSLDKFAITYEGKEGALSYSVAARGMTEADLQPPNPQALIGKVALKANARMPIAWLEKIMTEVAKEKGEDADPAKISQMVDMAVGVAQMGGYVTRDGDNLASAAQFENGQLTVNGKPKDISAALAGLLAGRAGQGGDDAADEGSAGEEEEDEEAEDAEEDE